MQVSCPLQKLSVTGPGFRDQAPEVTSPHLLNGEQEQVLSAEQDKLLSRNKETSVNRQETEIYTILASHTPWQPLQNRPSGHFLGWANQLYYTLHKTSFSTHCVKTDLLLIYPLNARVVGAPQMISQPVSTIFPCSPVPSGTWRFPGLSIPWCCLPTSSSVCLVFFPLSLCLAKMVLARPDERETWPYHCSLRLFTMVRRSSCGPIACRILARTSSFVTWSLYEMCCILQQHLISSQETETNYTLHKTSLVTHCINTALLYIA